MVAFIIFWLANLIVYNYAKSTDGITWIQRINEIHQPEITADAMLGYTHPHHIDNRDSVAAKLLKYHHQHHSLRLSKRPKYAHSVQWNTVGFFWWMTHYYINPTPTTSSRNIINLIWEINRPAGSIWDLYTALCIYSLDSFIIVICENPPMHHSLLSIWLGSPIDSLFM